MSIEENDVLGEQIEELFDALDCLLVNFNDAEETFVKDMKERWDKGQDFSEGQVKWIEQLYSKYIDGEELEDTYERFKRS